jgi:hypothetical protein
MFIYKIAHSIIKNNAALHTALLKIMQRASVHTAIISNNDLRHPDMYTR